jgi:hypothetical protein
MSQVQDDPDPVGDEPPAESQVRAKQSQQDGIQFDAYGIKTDFRPMEIGEPPPRTWKEVRDAVHAKLKVIAVNIVGVAEDFVVGTRKLIRGLTDIPAAAARRIDRAHERGSAGGGPAGEVRDEAVAAPRLGSGG